MVRLLLPILIGLVALFSIEFSGVKERFLAQNNSILLAGLALLSGLVLALSRSVVNQADRISELIGQPFGPLVLTATVMTVELALVASTMLTGESNPTLARYSISPVMMMITLTGVNGICNVLAAVRSGMLGSDGQVDTSQMAEPSLLGALTYWDLISTMCVLALVLPNFSRSTSETNFSTPVNVVLSVVALGVYAIFLTAQIGLYRSLYTEREDLIVAVAGGGEALENLETDNRELPLGKASSLLVTGLLVVCLIA